MLFYNTYNVYIDINPFSFLWYVLILFFRNVLLFTFALIK